MLDNIEKALEHSKQVFTDYAKHHARKNDPTQDVKVRANTEHAKIMKQALADLKKYRERLESRYLTQEEVNKLPVGTKVIVHWSGGNNNCQYEIAGHRNGEAYVNNIYNDVLDFVGIDPPKTMVRKAAINIIKGE